MAPQNLTPKEMLARLVAFDTTSVKTNIPLIAFVEDYLSSHGIESERVASDDGKHSSLHAVIGPEDMPGIGLSGHTDVVPVEGQTWASDPFTLTQRDSRLYGRGSCDMKGFVACILAHAPEFKARDLKTPIHLLLSYNEEVGCTGVRPMIAELGKRLPAPRLVIVGEPTSMKVVDAHKSIHGFETHVTGKESHSGKPHLGVNAIMAAGELIAELIRMDKELRARADGPRFDPPYTNIAVALIDGGTARNITPKSCTFTWMFRTVPATDPEEITSRFKTFAEQQVLPAMKKVSEEASIVTTQTSDVPSLNAPAGSQAVSLALKLAGQNETFAVSYGTEGTVDMTERNLNYAAPGAMAYTFWIDKIVGGAIVDRLDRKGLAVFIGIGVNSRYSEAAAEDVRVEFVESSGRVHPVEADALAAGANCMLFRSPDGMDTRFIRYFRVLINSSADWAKRGS